MSDITTQKLGIMEGYYEITFCVYWVSTRIFKNVGCGVTNKNAWNTASFPTTVA